MALSKKLIVANWKLNPITVTEAKRLAVKIKSRKKTEVVVCPPSVFLGLITAPIKGAQDVFWQVKGPFTGQTSAATLRSLKVKYCIVGHSERRAVGETDEQVAAKVHALLECGITPIICVGYGTQVSQDDLEVVDVLKGQLQQALRGVDAAKVVVAYEPVWAISSGNPYQTKRTPTPEHVEKIAIFIQTRMAPGRVLYGGSSNSANAEGYLSCRHIDGLLVGGASLIPSDFNKITEIAETLMR